MSFIKDLFTAIGKLICYNAGMIKYKPINGHPDYLIGTNGCVFSINRGIFLSQRPCGKDYKKIGGGYMAVSLDKRKPARVHRLVAEHFLENPNSLSQVNHKNGIKSDNRLENLEWCTCSHNHKHAFKKGLRHNKCGELSHLSKLSNNDVSKIRELIKTHIPQKDIAKIYHISPMAISNIKLRKTWNF